MITLKPKLSTFIVMMFGGLFFFYMGTGIWMTMREFNFVLLILIVIGCWFSFFGIHVLLNRKHHLLQIGPMGIKIRFLAESGG
jgi:hypothetical protein